MAPIRSRGYLIPNMSFQLNARYPRRNANAGHSLKPIYEERLLGREKIQLLKAPGIDAEVMWKQQCFESVYNRLRAKLNDSCSADNLITVFNSHFPISTLPAEDQARSAVSRFRSAFGNVTYLAPTSFLNRNGEDVTGDMLDTPRPAHVCHLGVTAEIKMHDISTAFDRDTTFSVNYFLPLPQSFGRETLTPSCLSSPKKTAQPPTLGSAEVMDSTMFSTPSRPPPKINLSKDVLMLEEGFKIPTNNSFQDTAMTQAESDFFQGTNVEADKSDEDSAMSSANKESFNAATVGI